jgi:mannose-6-phosphate isomerase-like protein (cupin superfamily)
MPVALEGGCRVTALREGEPRIHGALRVWPHFGRERGANAISLRILELSAGGVDLRNDAADEVLYVLGGEGVAAIGGREQRLSRDVAFYLAPGQALTLRNDGPAPLLLASVRCPDPSADGVVSQPPPAAPPSKVHPFVCLGERRPQTTADRWYCTLVDEALGSAQVTQFVGGIPPGRAPDHVHHYEEVLVILAGRGRMWAGPSSTPIEPGSCVYLPKRQVHCVENAGQEELRLLGVFYPAGSPAVRYDAG